MSEWWGRRYVMHRPAKDRTARASRIRYMLMYQFFNNSETCFADHLDWRELLPPTNEEEIRNGQPHDR